MTKTRLCFSSQTPQTAQGKAVAGFFFPITGTAGLPNS
jgi:hypothetical protein